MPKHFFSDVSIHFAPWRYGPFLTFGSGHHRVFQWQTFSHHAGKRAQRWGLSLRKFNSLPLKNAGWKTSLSSWGPVCFQGQTVELRSMGFVFMVGGVRFSLNKLVWVLHWRYSADFLVWRNWELQLWTVYELGICKYFGKWEHIPQFNGLMVLSPCFCLSFFGCLGTMMNQTRTVLFLKELLDTVGNVRKNHLRIIFLPVWWLRRWSFPHFFHRSELLVLWIEWEVYPQNIEKERPWSTISPKKLGEIFYPTHV